MSLNRFVHADLCCIFNETLFCYLDDLFSRYEEWEVKQLHQKRILMEVKFGEEVALSLE